VLPLGTIAFSFQHTFVKDVSVALLYSANAQDQSRNDIHEMAAEQVVTARALKVLQRVWLTRRDTDSETTCPGRTANGRSQPVLAQSNFCPGSIR
jgi:uncharacterized protein YecT (DUF1311 family)